MARWPRVSRLTPLFCRTFRQSSGTGYDIKSSFSSGRCTLASVRPFIRYHDKGIDDKERNLTDKGYLMCGARWGATSPVALCPQASETIGLNSRYFQQLVDPLVLQVRQFKSQLN